MSVPVSVPVAPAHFRILDEVEAARSAVWVRVAALQTHRDHYQLIESGWIAGSLEMTDTLIGEASTRLRWALERFYTLQDDALALGVLDHAELLLV